LKPRQSLRQTGGLIDFSGRAALFSSLFPIGNKRTVSVNGRYAITFVARKEWIIDEVKEQVKKFKRIKILFLPK
jgi:hypothetical protein